MARIIAKPSPQSAVASPTPEFFYRQYRDILPHGELPLLIIHQWYKEGHLAGPSRHEDFYALYVIQGGRGYHVINGHPYAVARGDVYMTPPGTIHAYRDFHSLRAEAFCFPPHLFNDTELAALRSQPGFWQLFVEPERASPFGDYHLHLSPERHAEVEAMMDELNREIAGPLVMAQVLARALFLRLLVYLARRQSERHIAPEAATGSSRGAAHGEGLAAVLRYCEAHYAEPLSVPQLAGLMYLSPGHFSELFAREIGMPPATYIRRLRLERAQTLLRKSKLPATAIAHQVGFTDLAQFSRSFRAAFGLTPSDYRATFRSK